MRAFLYVIVAVLALGCSKGQNASSTAARGAAATSQPAATAAQKCEHGVDSALCTRCKPALAAAFKSKGDWCPEHDRPESQCVLCNPQLAQQGVK